MLGVNLTLTARMVIMSHLSDVQEELIIPALRAQANTRLNFIKFLLQKFTDNSVLIDPEYEWYLFDIKHIKRLKPVTYFRVEFGKVYLTGAIKPGATMDEKFETFKDAKEDFMESFREVINQSELANMLAGTTLNIDLSVSGEYESPVGVFFNHKRKLNEDGSPAFPEQYLPVVYFHPFERN